jgi:hypothetical protein
MAVSPHELDVIKDKIKAKGDEIRLLKEQGTAKDALGPHIEELLALKSQLPLDDNGETTMKAPAKPETPPKQKQETPKKQAESTSTPEVELSESELRQNRLSKVDLMREAGLDPFEYSFDRTHTATALAELYNEKLENGEEDEAMVVSVAGRIMTRRIFGKKLAFFTLQDETGTIQLQFGDGRLGDSFRVRVYQLSNRDGAG